MGPLKEEWVVEEFHKGKYVVLVREPSEKEANAVMRDYQEFNGRKSYRVRKVK